MKRNDSVTAGGFDVTKMNEIEFALKTSEKVIGAIEKAVGVKIGKYNVSKNTMPFSKVQIDTTEIKELYKDDFYKPLIDKFLELGKIDPKRIGL